MCVAVANALLFFVIPRGSHLFIFLSSYTSFSCCVISPSFSLFRFFFNGLFATLSLYTHLSCSLFNSAHCTASPLLDCRVAGTQFSHSHCTCWLLCAAATLVPWEHVLFDVLAQRSAKSRGLAQYLSTRRKRWTRCGYRASSILPFCLSAVAAAV